MRFKSAITPLWNKLMDLRARTSTSSRLSRARSSSGSRPSFSTRQFLVSNASSISEFQILSDIGRGSFGIVKLARHVRTGVIVAIKVLHKQRIRELKQETNLLREQMVHLSLDYPLIVTFYTTFQDADAIYMVIEFCSGGELYSLVYTERDELEEEPPSTGTLARKEKSDRSLTTATDSESEIDEIKTEPTPLSPSNSKNVSTRQDVAHSHCSSHRNSLYKLDNEQARRDLQGDFGGLKEAHVVFYAGCVLLALEHVHSVGILYRDVKLENVLLDTCGYPKLIDFGLAKPGASDAMSVTICGSVEYMAPEMLRRKEYGACIELWAFGILLYELFCGVTPFQHDNRREMSRRILEDDVVFPLGFAQKHPEAVELMTWLLQKQSVNRPQGWQDVKRSRFFQQFYPNERKWLELANRKVKAPFVPKLESDVDISLFPPEEEM